MCEKTVFVLRYPDSDEKVCVGDYIARKKLFYPFSCEQLGRIIFVPGQLPPHPELDTADGASWAVRFDNGVTMAWLYHPQVHAIKRFRLLKRGSTRDMPTVEDPLFEE